MTYDYYGLTVIDCANGEYAIAFSDSKLDNAVREYISDTAWAFRSSFLSYHCDLDSDIIEMLQEKCEGSNDAILRLIKDFDHFVDDAVRSDGYGLFLAPYDHKHIKINYDDIMNFHDHELKELIVIISNNQDYLDMMNPMETISVFRLN